MSSELNNPKFLLHNLGDIEFFGDIEVFGKGNFGNCSGFTFSPFTISRRVIISQIRAHREHLKRKTATEARDGV